MIDGIVERLIGGHVLRRLSGIEEAGGLRTRFARAYLLALQLRDIGEVEQSIRLLAASIAIRSDVNWTWTLPLPARRPFRKSRLRIDGDTRAAALHQMTCSV